MALKPASAVRLLFADGSLKTKSRTVVPRRASPAVSRPSAAALTRYRYSRLRITGETVLPCAGDLSRTARNPGLPQMPHQGGAQGARSAALSALQGALPHRGRHPRDAHRRGEAREGVEDADVARAAGLTPAATP